MFQTPNDLWYGSVPLHLRVRDFPKNTSITLKLPVLITWQHSPHGLEKLIRHRLIDPIQAFLHSGLKFSDQLHNVGTLTDWVCPRESQLLLDVFDLLELHVAILEEMRVDPDLSLKSNFCIINSPNTILRISNYH